MGDEKIEDKSENSKKHIHLRNIYKIWQIRKSITIINIFKILKILEKNINPNKYEQLTTNNTYKYKNMKHQKHMQSLTNTKSHKKINYPENEKKKLTILKQWNEGQLR